MSTNQKAPSHEERLREYDREMLRSTFVSIFWAAITERRKTGKFTLQSIADKLGIDKSAVSRWFSGDSPNWETDTIADIAGVLDLELDVTAVERSNPAVTITATGPIYSQASAQTSTSNTAVQQKFFSQEIDKKPVVPSEPKQGNRQHIEIAQSPRGISPNEVWAEFSEVA
jgi:transcriptional regulator with XRE-family HTH domain